MGSEKKSDEERIEEFKKALDGIIEENKRKKEEKARKRKEEAKKIQDAKDLPDLMANLDLIPKLPPSEREVIIEIFHKLGVKMQRRDFVNARQKDEYIEKSFTSEEKNSIYGKRESYCNFHSFYHKGNNDINKNSYFVWDEHVIGIIIAENPQLNLHLTHKMHKYLYLKFLPEIVENLRNLSKLLILSIKTRIQKLPESIGNLSNLKKLIISGNPNLISLPDSIGELSKLEELYLNFNKNISELPESIGKLSNLKKIQIIGNPNLISLPDSIGELSKLEELDLRSNNLASLPRNIGNLSNLKKMKLSANELEYLPESFRNLILEYSEIKKNPLRNLVNFNFDTLRSYHISITNLTEKAKNILDPYFYDREYNLHDGVGDPYFYDRGGNITENYFDGDEHQPREIGEISIYYKKSTSELAKQYCQSQKSLTHEEFDRLVWEASSKEREMLESVFPADNEIIKKINDRLSVQLKDDSKIIL